MKKLILILIALSSVCAIAQSEPVAGNKQKPNILLICIDDLRPELPSFGKDYIHAPNMEKLFTQGRLFKRHYVQAPTCGASRFALLTGLYPNTGKRLSNQAIATHDHKAEPTFPAWLQQHGYTTVAVGKVTHYPGGLTGKNWNEADKPEIKALNTWTRNINSKALCAEWENSQTLMHGYANGKGRIPRETPAIETSTDARYPDDAITDAALKQMELLTTEQKPWLLAVGFIRPHLPFACDKKFLDLYSNKTIPNYSTAKPNKGEMWHHSGEFNVAYKNKINPNKDAEYADLVRKHYAACVSSTDHQIGVILNKLNQSGLDKNTIIILWGDHGWHLGEQQIWGKHTLYEVALHSPLFMKLPVQKNAGIACDQVVNSVDIYPTLCHLTQTPLPKHIEGESLVKQLIDPSEKTKNLATSYWGNMRSEITLSDHKIMNAKTKEVLQHYNLDKDPQELNNLIKLN